MAQFNLIPYGGVSASKMVIYDRFENGGNSALAGLEIEWKRKSPKHVIVGVSTGVSYLNSHFYYSSTVALTFDNEASAYSYKSLEVHAAYWQVPLIFKIFIAPFPLIEDYALFFGAGFNNNFRINARLSETFTRVEDPSNYANYIETGPLTSHFSYRDLDAGEGDKHTLYGRMELGMRYKRIQISFRLSRSITDTYFKGIEGHAVFAGQTDGVTNSAYSMYLNTHASNQQITTQMFQELIIGYRAMK